MYIFKNIKNNKKLLNNFRVIKFKAIEKFQEDDNIVDSSNYYDNNMLILDDLIMTNTGNGKKSFNSKMKIICTLMKEIILN